MTKLVLGLVLGCMVALPALAQDIAPAPRSAPRTPVHREALNERHIPRDVTGQALVIDGERLKIGDADMRLFGIVPPQLSANFGPQARAALDGLIGGGQAVTCAVRDRDHDGRLLATCRSAAGADPALELLRRGLAVAARGSIADTELAQPYVVAEQAAQAEKLGLWSVIVAAPVAGAIVAETPKPPVIAPVETSKTAEKTASAVMVPVRTASVAESGVVSDRENPGLFARYQIIIAGTLMLVTALSILGAIALQRSRDKRDEMKALAAALRGELMAARAVCLTRVKNIVTDEDDRAASWPRIRSTLYQAYVGKLGWLGAELARQVASIYGQASDYASYYNHLGDNVAPVAAPKRQALQTLAAHIDGVLPRLAAIEQTGHRTAPSLDPAVTSGVPPLAEIPLPMIASASVAEAGIEDRLRNVVRHWRDRLIETRVVSTADEMQGDYAALVEEDAEHFSLGGDEESGNPPIAKTGGF